MCSSNGISLCDGDGRTGNFPDRQTTPDPAASADSRVIVIAVTRALVQHGLLHLLDDLGTQGHIRISRSAAETGRLLQVGNAAVLLTDPQHALQLHRIDPNALASLRTLVITPRDHAGAQAVPAYGGLCGMLSEKGCECSFRLLLLTLLDCQFRGAEDQRCGGCELQATLEPPRLPLSPRELQIFLRIGEGMGPTQIASESGLSVKTVESYREKIKQKLQLSGRDAVLSASMRWRSGYFIEGASTGDPDSPALSGVRSHCSANCAAGRGSP